MTKTFLTQIAEYIHNRHKEDIENIALVLPSRRAVLYLKKDIATVFDKTIWSPSFLTIEDFIEELSDIKITDNVNLLFELYEVHKEIEADNHKSFDEFMSIGEQILRDFNDIDLNNCNAEKIFNYIDEAKAMSVWNIDNKPLSDFQKNYLKFYNTLYIYYQKLNLRLKAKAIGYQGAACRTITENINDIIDKVRYTKIYFVGLFGINKSEEIIIKKLIEQGRGEIIFDADRYYLKDGKEKFETNYYFKKYVNTYNKDFKWWADDYKTSEKTINIYACPLNITQIKKVNNLLEEIQKTNTDLSKTAVIIPNEQLLIPLLNSIPESIKDINITLGYSLKYTAFYDLLNIIFAMQENIMKLGKVDNFRKNEFYYRDIIKLINNSYIQQLMFKHANAGLRYKSELIEKINKANKVFLNFDDIASILKSYNNINLNAIEPLFRIFNKNCNAFVKMINRLIIELRNIFINQKKEVSTVSSTIALEIEIEYLYNFNLIFNLISNFAEGKHDIMTMQTLSKLVNIYINNYKIPFVGEPLRGLQIMGFLESRAIDFENVIILNVNENVIPSAKSHNSFIPVDIRVEYGLPTYKDRESISAYMFYNLIQRAKNVYLLYNTEVDDFGKGERSRYISQMIYEPPAYNPKIKINENVVAHTYTFSDTDDDIVIEKSKFVTETIDKLCAKGISPSAFNTYIACPLKFYFNYILGIREAEEITEEVDAALFGTIIHKVLQEFFVPYHKSAKNMVAADIDAMMKTLPQATAEAFIKTNTNLNINYGKNLLIRETIIKYLENYLGYEKNLLKQIETKGNKFYIKQLEAPLRTEINVRDKKVVLKGFADRIDFTGDTIRIVDYKTGKVMPADLKIADIDELVSNRKYDKALQLYIYGYIYMKQFGLNNYNLKLGILPVKTISMGFVPLVGADNSDVFDNAKLKEIESILFCLVEDIYDTQKPFCKTADIKVCSYCEFSKVCNR